MPPVAFFVAFCIHFSFLHSEAFDKEEKKSAALFGRRMREHFIV